MTIEEFDDWSASDIFLSVLLWLWLVIKLISRGEYWLSLSAPSTHSAPECVALKGQR